MLRLLEALWGNRVGYAELRVMREGVVEREFFKWPDEDGVSDLISFVESNREDHDIYFGVLLRTRKAGKAEDCEAQTEWLWADIDKKGGVSFSDILRSPVPTPQVIVDSGRGWHLYWRLSTPLNHDKAQALMTSLAHQLRGDMVGDPARILRLPGTLNHKDDVPHKVRIIRMRDLDKPWRVGDFDLRPSASEWRTTAALTGRKGTRSEDLFKVAIEGIRNGLSDEDIYEEMLSRPEGSKLTEMKKGRADRWVALTIKKARAALGGM